jgi:hypothetical protein
VEGTTGPAAATAVGRDKCRHKCWVRQWWHTALTIQLAAHTVRHAVAASAAMPCAAPAPAAAVVSSAVCVCVFVPRSPPAPVIVHHLAQNLAAILQHGGQRLSIALVVVCVGGWGGGPRQQARQGRGAEGSTPAVVRQTHGNQRLGISEDVVHAVLERVYAQHCCVAGWAGWGEHTHRG